MLRNQRNRRKSPQPAPPRAAAARWLPRFRTVATTAVLLLFGGLILADWWRVLPEGTTATYVGKQSCIECHTAEHGEWAGSDHDLAMDRATPQSVLGNFDNVELTHYAVTSRMFRRDDKYMIHTEGPDGKMSDFEIKYVFGVRPLQQYMVEFDRPDHMPENEIARLQVLRVSWDTERKKWFYLSPPDVHERLEPNDELHWTGVAQRWNTSCAECHSTNLQKNYDLESNTYHTTFSEIDVSCEACHGPGSIHVQLANARSLFWDRKLGYGLARLKDKNTDIQIQTCGRCHSRQSNVYPDFHPGDNYYDHFMLSPILPSLYYPDGQILDEDYVHGSFVQSKMYHKEIRCTDCHNPHTARLKHEGNEVCTSCHTHSAGKYDGPLHHHHKDGSAGAACVECHMPETTYMDVDPRRDHSLRIPRPDLSVKLGVPNACTGCHLDPEKLAPEKRTQLATYSDWLIAARRGDEPVKAELARLDAWSAAAVTEWFGPREDTDSHFANTLADAWRGAPQSQAGLIELAGKRSVPAIVRASALVQLAQFESPPGLVAARQSLKDPHPLIRAMAAGNHEVYLRQFATEEPRETAALLKNLVPLLSDPVRLVRTEAARVLTAVPPELQSRLMTGPDRDAHDLALNEFRQRLRMNDDRATSHLTLGVLYETQGDLASAIRAYRKAIRVEPMVIGPRRNLAAVLERQAQQMDADFRRELSSQPFLREDPAAEPRLQARIKRVSEQILAAQSEVEKLRLEELQLLERRARLLPDNAESQYEYGLFLALHNRVQEAEQALAKAHQLEPKVPQYLLGLTYFYQKYERWDEAIKGAEQLVQLRPDQNELQGLLDEIRRQASQRPRIGPQPDVRN